MSKIMHNVTSRGFLLTRNSRDRGRRTEIEYWVATSEGPARLLLEDEKPIFFILQEDQNAAESVLSGLKSAVEVKPLAVKNFQGQSIAGVYSATINDNFTAQDLIRHNGIKLFEADFRLHDRYLIERFVNGGLTFRGICRQMDGYRQFNQCQVRADEYSIPLRVLSLDIECAMDGELYSVGLATDVEDAVSQVLMIGEPEPCTKLQIHWFRDEASLITGLCARIIRIDPDLIVGWNLVNFDFKILIARAEMCKVPFRIGRGNSLATWRNVRGDPTKGYITIPGRLAIDGIDALKSATWNFPSFSLENVAQTLLSRGKKAEQDVDDRVAEISHNFHHNKTALAAYNLEDCKLVLDIFSHTRIVEYLILRSQMTGLELDRAGGSVAAFTNQYLPRLHRAGYIAPNLPADGGLASPGGYVMNSRPGLYKNVLVLDFKSLYPSIIRTFRIDPMGLVEGLLDPDNAIEGFRGGKFHRDKHFLPSIISELWQQRDVAKKDGDRVRSRAIKIIMNSFYGVLGSGGCRFYDQRLASSITMRGHEIMQTTREWIESEGYAVIYGDTDSTFVSLDESLDHHRCREIGQMLQNLVNDKWQRLLCEKYELECFLEIEFETHFSRFLMPTIRGSEAGSKKRYAGLIVDQDGKEKIIFKGLENVRTDWTALAKDFQAALFDLVFHDQDPTELVRGTVERMEKGLIDDKLVYRKQLRRKLDAYVKNVPPHVRAARLADDINAKRGRSLKYQNKGWISYIMTEAGPQPLEYRNASIDHQHYLQRQLKPVADAVLPFVGMGFDSVISAQTELF